MTEFGVSIPICEIVPKRRVSDATLTFYRRVTIKVNQMMGVPDPNRLYYEYFGKPEIRKEIMQRMPEIFKLTTPTAFTSKMASVKSLMLSVPDLPSEISVLWNKKYDEPQLIQTKEQQELKQSWGELKKKLLKIAEDKSKDSRLRIMCYIYGSDLVVRTSVMITTKIDEDDGHSNFYNKDTGEWFIRKTKTGVAQTIQVPEPAMKGIAEIIQRLPWIYNEWLVPRLNGQSYVTLSLSTFTPWKREGLPGCNECRHTFETHNWNSGQTHDQAAEKSKLLDHNPSTVSNFYIKKKPRPVIKLRENTK